MISYIEGNILESDAQALVNTVNTQGVMGKGIALQFKSAFPGNFKTYKEACSRHEVQVGKMFVTKDTNLMLGERIIINFPTKTSWRNPSEYSYIESGLDDLILTIQNLHLKSIAIPPLGAGNGGLQWVRVKKILEDKLSRLDADIYVYQPTASIKERLKHERVALTPARALLIYMLFDLVKQGEFVSEFSSEKICYFLQRFGGQPYFNLEFTPQYYGPYSGKVRYVLNALNGSYVSGYSGMNKGPFEPLLLIPDGYPEVSGFMKEHPELQAIADKTTQFLDGYYSDFALELLSSMDYLASRDTSGKQQLVFQQLKDWNTRKSRLFGEQRYLDTAWGHLKSTALI